MRIHTLHPWNLSLENAKAVQRNLRAWVISDGSCKQPKMIGRITLSSSDETLQSATVQARITIIEYPSLTLLERKVAIKTTRFPLEQGLQSFRKMPAVIAALEKLNRVPDVFICDGKGITSETSFGVASHVGLVTGVPTIGLASADSVQLNSPLGLTRGSYLPATDRQQFAAVTRVLDATDPILISPAHKISLSDAIDRVLDYFPANTGIRDYLQAIYPETGHNDEKPVQLKLVK